MVQREVIDTLIPIDSAWVGSLHPLENIGSTALSVSYFNENILAYFILALLILVLIFKNKIPFICSSLVKFDTSASLNISRISLFIIACPVLVTALVQYSIVSPFLFYSLTPTSNYLIFISFLFCYFIAKMIIYSMISSVTTKSDIFIKIVRASLSLFVIVTVLIILPLPFMYILSDPNMEAIRLYCLIISGLAVLVYFFYEVRLFISSQVSLILTFLYLCTLEILPVAILISLMTKD